MVTEKPVCEIIGTKWLHYNKKNIIALDSLLPKIRSKNPFIRVGLTNQTLVSVVKNARIRLPQIVSSKYMMLYVDICLSFNQSHLF